MALAHQFIIRGPEEEIMFSTEQEYVFVPDYLMQYLSDSMQWIHTSWNDQIELEGFPEEGFAIITELEVEHILMIIQPFRALFKASPETFSLTVRESSRACYREVNVTRKEIVEEVEGWIRICNLALQKHCRLLYKGL